MAMLHQLLSVVLIGYADGQMWLLGTEVIVLASSAARCHHTITFQSAECRQTYQVVVS